MGILSIFKKIFAEEKKQEVKPLEITFEQIPQLIQDKEQLFKLKEKQLSHELENLIKRFIPEIKNRIELLKAVNLNERKEQEKIKLVVKANLNHYLNYLHKLISDLEKYNEIELLEHKINEFLKLSQPAFEKSTILIGQELGETKQILASLLKEFVVILNNHKTIQAKLKEIKTIQEQIARFKEIQEIKTQSNEQISLITKKKLEEKNKILKKEKEILDFISSQEYLTIQNTKSSNEERKITLEKQLEALKEKIDFKALGNIFHTIEDKNNLIKAYQDNFKKALEQDRNFEIIELSKFINLDVSNIKYLKLKLNEISKVNYPPEEKLKSFQDTLITIKDSLFTLDSELNKEEAKIKKHQEKSHELKANLTINAKNFLNSNDL